MSKTFYFGRFDCRNTQGEIKMFACVPSQCSCSRTEFTGKLNYADLRIKNKKGNTNAAKKYSIDGIPINIQIFKIYNN